MFVATKDKALQTTTTGSFMDYTMPRATDVPSLDVDFHEVPSPTNPLGAKGVGEAGITGALPALMNAVADVISAQGRTVNFDMPATPEKIWRALHG